MIRLKDGAGLPENVYVLAGHGTLRVMVEGDVLFIREDTEAPVGSVSEVTNKPYEKSICIHFDQIDSAVVFMKAMSDIVANMSKQMVVEVIVDGTEGK